MSSDASARKSDHLRLTLEGDVEFRSLTTGLDDYQLVPRALPERALSNVDLGVAGFGRSLPTPLLISCMTGGTSEAGPVNRALAVAAQEHGVSLGLGSGRVLLEGGSDAGFLVRDVAPDVFILANLGAVQLHQHRPDDCARLVERCAADALVLHANAVQEAVQPGGDTDFSGLLARIEAVCAGLDVPVVVKEVGFGLAPADVRALVTAPTRASPSVNTYCTGSRASCGTGKGSTRRSSTMKGVCGSMMRTSTAGKSSGSHWAVPRVR